MRAELITESPSWFIVLCLLFGALCSFVLYFREVKFEESNRFVRGLMAFFRFLTISVISFFLLGPFLKTNKRKVEKPIIIFAQDNSESIVFNKDSLYYKGDYGQDIQKLLDELKDKYEVVSYSFGEELQEGIDFKFDDKETDFSKLFTELQTRYKNRNVGALLIASDGLYNKGTSPLYGSSKLKVPIYTIALGDTSKKKDLLLADVNFNRLAFLGNKFPIEIAVRANDLSGVTSTLKVLHNGKTEFEQVFQIEGSGFERVYTVILEAVDPGIQHYQIQLKGVNDESVLTNNRVDVFIDVLDSRQKILILANAPHPDIKAVRSAILENENYEVETRLMDDFTGNLEAFNLVVLHQLPTNRNKAQKLIAEIRKTNTPALFIVGNQTSINDFNNLKIGLTIDGNNRNFNNTLPILNGGFSLFKVSDEFGRRVKKFPPLSSPFGTYRGSFANNVLLSQKIGAVATEQPLCYFYINDNAKMGVITGEGIWRWKLSEYALYDDNIAFNEFVLKTIQYLSVKQDKSHFRVKCEKDYKENEPITFSAELYNESYELINDPDVSLIIKNNEGKEFPFVFSKAGTGYRLNTGLFPVGQYTYEAKVRSGEKILLETGGFSVSPLMLESTEVVADHGLLFNLAERNNGKLIGKGQTDELAKLILEREDIKPVIFNEKRLQELIDQKWIFYLLLGWLSIEWFVRKWQGAY